MRNRITYWRYISQVLNEYPTLKMQTELTEVQRRKVNAISSALDRIDALADGKIMQELIGLVYFRKTHNLVGAALLCHVSERTAQRWQQKFIKLVAVELGIEEQEK